MAQSKTHIQALLSAAGAAPRHRLGQNFMIDQNLVRLVADAGELASDDWAVEVGPGTGTLTDELLARAGRVIAVEIDRDLAALLREQYAGAPGFELIEGDALAGKHALHPALVERIGDARAAGQALKLVANLPYNIASPLVVELLLAGVELLAFTVQKEVAQRLCAAPGSDAYGPLSVMAQLLGRVQLLRKLPPQAFWPAPRIESALVRIRRGGAVPSDAAGISALVHQLFSARRKTLRNALIQADLPADALLAATQLDGRDRPEVLAPNDFVRLWRAIPPVR